MSWILAMYLFSSDDVLAREFKTEAECKKMMHQISKAERNNADVKDITCTQGIVIADNDDIEE